MPPPPPPPGQWARDLEELCTETADERSCLEASAYASWMSGNVFLEKEEWADALERFGAAHRICEELSKVGRIEDQDLFARRVEEMEPILRYCRYNIQSRGGDPAEAEARLLEMGRGREGGGASGGGDLLAAKLESVLAKAHKKQARALDSVEWRGKRVAVRSEAIKLALIKADELAERILPSPGGGRGGGDPRPGQYLKVFGAYDDALSAVGREAGQLQGKGGGAKMEAQRVEYEALRAYAQHKKLRLMVQRNERLVEDLQRWRSGDTGGVGSKDLAEKAADIVHVYDALLQSVRAMITNLRGGEDTSGDLEEEDELYESAKADEARFRAFRCFFLTEAFTSREKWTEAVALFEHTRRLCTEAAEMLYDDDPRMEALIRLEGMIEGAQHRPAAHALLLKAREELTLSKGVKSLSIGGGNGAGGVIKGHTLQERLLEFDAGREEDVYSIGNFPPSLCLIPCKPRLLDLAFDYLEFPDLDGRAGIVREIPASAGGVGEESSSLRGWVGWAFGRT
ncbi:unnamed protein product [Discosporangium mesarthrocarpum]